MRKSPELLPDKISISWHIEDILCRDASLSTEQCREILDFINRTHQADVGVNWEVIDAAIQFYKETHDIGE